MYTDKYKCMHTHIIVCIHKNVCMNKNYRSNYLYFLYKKWNKNYIPQHHC